MATPISLPRLLAMWSHRVGRRRHLSGTQPKTGFAIGRPVLPHTPASSPNRLSSDRLHPRSTVEVLTVALSRRLSFRAMMI
jgi:hypothetical protein